MTDPGKYSKRITFQLYDGTVDFAGDVRDDDDTNWDDFKTVWASINPISGKELYEAGMENSVVTHKIRCRYFEGAKAEMRIKHGVRIFRIVSPPIDWGERREEFLIMVKELVL